MTPTEVTLIIFTAILTAVMVFGVAARFTVKLFKLHKGGTEGVVMLLFVLAAVTGSCAAAVHYGLNTRQVAASAILGACGALSVLALLLTLGVTAVSRRAKISLLTVTVVAIVLLLQVAISVAYPCDFESGKPIAGGVIFARIVSGTFQYFSLDASYAEIITVGAAALPDGGTYVFYVLACAMTVIAPIVGGFAIFGALGHFFPKLSMWRSIQSTKYVFSELNEYSIETAESIVALKAKLATDKTERTKYIDRYGKEMYGEIMHSVIVFTDVYSDRKVETDAELLARANKINAICLKDDVLSRKIYWIAGLVYRAVTHTKKKVVYFLMDKSDFYVEQGDENNLRTAVALLSTDKSQMMWAQTHWWQFGMKANSVEIYVFSRNENADAIIQEAQEKWIKEYVDDYCNRKFRKLEKFDKKIKALDKKAEQAEQMLALGKANYEEWSLKTQALDGKERVRMENDLKSLKQSMEDLERSHADLVKVRSDWELAKAAIDKMIEKAKPKAEAAITHIIKYKTINEYQNLVYGLIDGDSEGAYPLYTALEQPPHSGNYNTEKLSVLIVGGGRIAKTFLKTAYRCGQMLCGDAPTKLRITVMSLDAEESERRLKFDMPAVFGDADNKNGYCEFKFIPATYGTAEFAESFRTVAIGGEVPDVDYILVALGADNLNMQAADYIRQELTRAGKKGSKIIPVNYVIENNELCAALVGDRAKKNDDNGICVLNPFGSLGERFSFNNISMSDIERRALAANETYANEKGKVIFKLDAYRRDSSIAAAMHSAYGEVCISENDDSFERRATWLEHRRWNAYMRSIGYRPHTASEFARHLTYGPDKDDYMRLVAKNKNLKLHACITECSDRVTSADDIEAFAAEHPDFYDIVQDSLDRIRGGETLIITAGGKRPVVSMDDFFDYLREKCKTDLDNLDILSAMSRGTKTENGKTDYSYMSYKDSDKNISKRLRQERKPKS